MNIIKREPDKGYIDSMLWVPKTKVNVNGTKAALTLSVAEGTKMTFFFLWKETDHHLLVPREFWDPGKCDFEIIDCRPTNYPRVEIESRITLDAQSPEETVQKDALAALLAARGGVLQLACGKGKTVVALEMFARLCVPALVIVDTSVLMTQWQREIKTHLRVPGGVGLIADGKFDWQKPIVMATYHSLANLAPEMAEEVRRWFGVVVWDEAHHVAAPTFSRSADLFYGRRYGLTATPKRDDGLHVVYDMHIGSVLFKDLRQDLKPRIYFRWTGFEIDGEDPITQAQAYDKNRELHLGKLAGYFGRWRARLDFIINEVNSATAEGRKILILSNSLDEAINLLAIWNGNQDLYSDIPVPTPAEFGSTLMPIELKSKVREKVEKSLNITYAQLKDPVLNPLKRKELDQVKVTLEGRLAQHALFKKIESELKKRQKAYLAKLLAQPSDAGLIIQKVKPEVRDHMLATKQVIFAISKYGKEGLDSPMLDTAIVLEPLSSRNTLQQLMGRVLRKKAGKKSPVVVFLEDNIGLLIGMCRKLKNHLRNWPVEEGGPYEYTLLGHPSTNPRRKGLAPWTPTRISSTSTTVSSSAKTA